MKRTESAPFISNPLSTLVSKVRSSRTSSPPTRIGKVICKHSRVLSIIRERLHREPSDGDVFIVMSRNRRIVRMFSFDNSSYSLFEKKFVAGYQFMRVERNGADTVYRIDWKDVVLILESPVVKILKIR